MEKQKEHFELDSVAFSVEKEKLLNSLKTKEAQEREEREENELLLTQLHQVQEELEKYYLENSAVKKELSQHVIISQANIHVLLQNCKALYTLNSGVGFEALFYKKPIFTFGKSE